MSRGAASIIRLEPVQSNCQCNQIRGFSLLKVESKDTLLSIEFFYFGRVTTIEIFQKSTSMLVILKALAFLLDTDFKLVKSISSVIFSI